MKKKISEVYDEIIAYELAFHGKTYKDIYGDGEWFNTYTMTTPQFEEWKKFSIALMMKECGFSKKYAELQFNWINLDHGLKIVNDESRKTEEST